MSESATVHVEAEIKGKEYRFDAPPGTNLLGAALQKKVPLDHICRVGLCGACQIHVEVGADSLSEPTEAECLLLDREPLAQGVRLACQVRVSDDVRIRQGRVREPALK